MLQKNLPTFLERVWRETYTYAWNEEFLRNGSSSLDFWLLSWFYKRIFIFNISQMKRKKAKQVTIKVPQSSI